MGSATATRLSLGGFLAALALPVIANGIAFAQDLGPFMPHDGGMLTTAWTNSQGPDAEAWMTFLHVTPKEFSVRHTSSRGVSATRRIRTADELAARTIVLGFSPKMPEMIPDATSLGTSAAVLNDLRTSGRASASLIYNDALATIPGRFERVQPDVSLPVLVEGRIVEVPTVHARGTFSGGNQKAEGDFYFLANRNNPLLIAYSVRFASEKAPRTERLVSVMAGASQRAAMEQALATNRTYDLYGIHFDFAKAVLRPDAASLVDDIAVTLKNNPLWKLKIVGHTDSIGKPDLNLRLSKDRANAVKAALVRLGIAPGRLTASGAGEADPKASNADLEGRAINRRVELTRTDR